MKYRSCERPGAHEQRRAAPLTLLVAPAGASAAPGAEPSLAMATPRCAARLLLLAGLLLAPPARGDDGSWRVAWEDTFDGPGLNASNWRVADGVGHNLGSGELQAYFADEVSVANGSLVIRTRLNPGTLNASDPRQSYNWTSGWVDTAGAVQLTFGKLEASIRLPEFQDGVWPAFWIEDDAEAGGAGAASTHCWPTGGEIDVLEAFGSDGGVGNDDGSIVATYHWGSSCGNDEWWADGAKQGRASRELFCGANGHFSDAFHNFSLYWNATTLTWAVDGLPIVTRRAGMPPGLFVPQWPLWVIINTAVDAYHGQPAHDWSDVFMFVDRITWSSWAGPSSGPGEFPVPVANETLNSTARARGAARAAGNAWAYGNPTLGCRPSEIDMSVTNLCSSPPCPTGNNSFCTPPCDATTKACATAYPPGAVGAVGECVVELNGFDRPTFCALVCSAANSTCGDGARCATVSSWGGPKREFCIYP